PFHMNTILGNPNSACGTSQVYIENWATAALYIYTPYRPNQAALNAQWGVGDAWSTYGNRNFYLFFQEWFGSTANPALTGKPFIDATYTQNSWLGAPLTDYNWSPSSGGGAVRGYENGAITWQVGSNIAYVISGDVR